MSDVEWVRMEHPDIDGTAVTTRQALDEVHAEKGWVLAVDQADEVPFTTDGGTTADDPVEDAPLPDNTKKGR
jgi:hypothetical protein